MEIKQSIYNSHVGLMLADGVRCLGGLDADLIGDEWHLCRLNVKLEARGKGYGRKLVELLKANSGGHRIVVHPGGYDLAQKDIEAFYKHMGFVENEDGFILEAQEAEQFLKENGVYDYTIVGDYFIGRWDVMFGTRIRAGKLFDWGVSIDVCCGKSEYLLCLVEDIYQKKMELNQANGEEACNGLRPISLIKPIDKDDDYMKWLAELKDEVNQA